VGPAEEAVAPSSSPVPGPEPLAGWVPASPFCAVSPSPPQADWEEGGSSVLILLQRRQSSSLDCRLPISAPDLPALGARLEVSVHGERLIGPESLAGWGPPLCAVSVPEVCPEPLADWEASLVRGPSHTLWPGVRPPRLMVPVRVQMRLEWASFGVAVCTSSGLQGHWKATEAREFLKRKALAALSTASMSMSRISGQMLGRSACDAVRYTAK
jgi:hypothetical protein